MTDETQEEGQEDGAVEESSEAVDPLAAVKAEEGQQQQKVQPIAGFGVMLLNTGEVRMFGVQGLRLPAVEPMLQMLSAAHSQTQCNLVALMLQGEGETQGEGDCEADEVPAIETPGDGKGSGLWLPPGAIES